MRYTLDAMLPERAFKKSLFKNAPTTLEGGGGGQQSSGPSSSTVTNTNIPEYARPYVENMLGATQQQLFNTKQNEDGSTQITGMKPYTPYGLNQSTGQAYTPQEMAGNMQVAQNAVAGFTPLQQQAQQGIANLQIPGQFAPATGAALAGTFGSLGAGQEYAQNATNPYAQQAYMSPYIQNALTPQLEEMQRQYGITGAQEASKATQQGAFGGGREAIMQAENNRNKNMAMNQAINQGYQNAFQAATQAQQYGANLGLQGYGQGVQGANALAGIGQQQLGAQQGIYGLQNQTGAQQQAQNQSVINQAIQNYAVGQQYPQQQLAFMNAQLRGLPMQSGTTQMYQAQPSAISQAAGLGTAGIAGLGLYNTMNKGV
jgi:hypothetical protein